MWKTKVLIVTLLCALTLLAIVKETSGGGPSLPIVCERVNTLRGIRCYGSEEFVALDRLCDNKTDCSNGADERCLMDGLLLPGILYNHRFCNGAPDCESTIDERCSDSGQWLCNNETADAVDRIRVCDGVAHCPNGEDEAKDLCFNTTTHPRGIACMNRHFQHWLCDGYATSPNGEDEDCSAPCATMKCGTDGNALIDVTNNEYRCVCNCSEGTVFDEESSSCVAVTCGKPKDIENGDHTPLPNGIMFGMTINFTCDVGYQLVGAQQIVCQSDGKWSDVEPTCKAIGPPCGPPEGIIMGTFDSKMDDREVHYDCRKGYQLIGNRNVECALIEDRYEWSSELPTCVRSRALPETCEPVAPPPDVIRE